MKIKYGKFSDVYLAPLSMLGLFYDVNHDGTYIWGLVFNHWFIGLTFSKRSKDNVG